MKFKITAFYCLCFLLFCPVLCIQSKNAAKIDSENKEFILNSSLLDSLFDKLHKIDSLRTGRINIVHVGDSHIQADFFTNEIRQKLQDRFGNAGYGFSFPYSLVPTNGTHRVSFVSDCLWNSQSLLGGSDNPSIGLSGYGLTTNANRFKLEVTATDSDALFNRITLIYPTQEPQFNLIVPKNQIDGVQIKSPVHSTFLSLRGKKKYRVRRGETLSTIAHKNRVSLVLLKKANHLRRDFIREGQWLTIPVKLKPIPSSPLSPSSVVAFTKADSASFAPMDNYPYCSVYEADSLLKTVLISPNQKQTQYGLNGIILQNGHSGILYDMIGVNGATVADYNKYALFFKQMPLLKPDLIILSFGTNESFAHLSPNEYLQNLERFATNVHIVSPHAVILLMTPPPSMMHRWRLNPYTKQYVNAFRKLNVMPVWDLYSKMGGVNAIKRKGRFSRMMARDRIHYDANGYRLMADMFVTDFLTSYDNYIKNQDSNNAQSASKLIAH